MLGRGDESTSQEIAIVSPIDAPYDNFCPSLHVGASVCVPCVSCNKRKKEARDQNRIRKVLIRFIVTQTIVRTRKDISACDATHVKLFA